MGDKIEFFDSHFHIWDVTEGGVHDKSILFAPNGNQIYTVALYENDLKQCQENNFKHTGGVFVEAMSVCFPATSAKDHQEKCIEEAKWSSDNLLHKSENKYLIVASACLEDPNVEQTLLKLSNISGVKGIRQIINFEPSWPRNKASGDLLKDENFCNGFSKLEKFNLTFDIQLNPHQFQNAYNLISANPKTKVVIDHFGSPSLEMLQNNFESFWVGLQKLSTLNNVYLKLSMLCYIDKEWDNNEFLIGVFRKGIELFGVQRCFFASNYPVDGAPSNGSWSIQRIMSGFQKIVIHYSKSDQQKLFAENAKQFYNFE